MLVLDHLSCRFGQTLAVDDLSLRFDRPELVGVIGRSGAGKSTLLRLINGLVRPTGGRILDGAGRDLASLDPRGRRAWAARTAMIFQQFNLVPRLDVATNILLGRLHDKALLPGLLGLFTRAETLEALAIAERLDILDLALQRAETLSGGQQQRVAIGRALMQRPQILLADEPIASLDPRNAAIVMETLARIQAEDKLLVLANLHTLETARRYCGRIVALARGRLVFDGPASDLTQAEARRIYGLAEPESFDPSLTEAGLEA